jgi:adenylylsulfate kinase-like enzyme
MESKNHKIVLILTGPGGSGKSKIARLLVQKYKFKFVNGDVLDTEFFPKGYQWHKRNSDKLKKTHDKILRFTKKLFNQGDNVVVDYIIFGNYLGFFKKFKKEFGRNLVIKVLFPSCEEMIKRDANRKCWTTGVYRIKSVRKEFEKLKDKIGKKSFIDTSGRSPEETAEIIFSSLKTKDQD